MSKITLSNFDELIVSDDVATFVQNELDQKRSKAEFPLNFYPLAVSHVDGMWSGTLKEITSISSSNKKSTKLKWFSSTKAIEDFHNQYGHGKFKTKYESGYGIIDVRTQFLLKIGKAKFTIHTPPNIIMIEWKDHKAEQGWENLWELYELNLDIFGELLPEQKRICKITE